MSAAAMKTVDLVTQELQSQTLNSIVGGFSFAAAMAWMDFVRWIITQVVKVPKNGGSQYALTALMTTLLSIIVYMIIFSYQWKGQEARPACLRGYPLSGLGLPFMSIIRSSPTTTIAMIYTYSFFHS